MPAARTAPGGSSGASHGTNEAFSIAMLDGFVLRDVVVGSTPHVCATTSASDEEHADDQRATPEAVAEILPAVDELGGRPLSGSGGVPALVDTVGTRNR